MCQCSSMPAPLGKIHFIYSFDTVSSDAEGAERKAKLVLKENAMYSALMCVRALMYEPRIMESLTSLSERGEQWTHRSEKHRASNL